MQRIRILVILIPLLAGYGINHGAENIAKRDRRKQFSDYNNFFNKLWERGTTVAPSVIGY